MRFSLRALLPALAVCLAVGVMGCASAIANDAAGTMEVRVLLYSGSKPIDVGSENAARAISLRKASDGRSVLVAGGETLGAQWVPEGKGPWRVGSRLVRGRIRVTAHKKRIRVFNLVDLEAYVSSTVGGEMSPSWPQEALRAQAVAARTYVLHEAAKRTRSKWDVRATAASQVYRGIAAESDETRAATKATRDQVLTYRGKPILAVFHSTAGGRTATAGEVWGKDLPYLKVIDIDEEEAAPHTYWRTQFASTDLAAILSESGIDVGRLNTVSVTKRTRSGRVSHLRVRSSDREEEVRGERLRRLVSNLGLRSTLFDIRPSDDGFAFVGSGYGHGVGMSQWGARGMAERGESYQRILARFYPGTRLEKWSSKNVALGLGR